MNWIKIYKLVSCQVLKEQEPYVSLLFNIAKRKREQSEILRSMLYLIPKKSTSGEKEIVLSIFYKS
jgi:hypothetical protein